MTEPLFYKYDLNATIENHRRAVTKEITSLPENQVLNTSQEDMVKYVSEKHVIDPAVIDESGIQMDYGDAQIDVSRDFRRVIFDRSTPFYITGTRVRFYIPFTRDPDLFHCRPSTYSLNLPKAAVRGNEVVFTYDFTEDQASGVRDIFERDLEQTRVHIQRVNGDVTKLNQELPEIARQALNARREKLLQDRNLVQSIGFPLRRRQNPPSTFTVPDVKRRITPPKPSATSAGVNPEPTLDMNEYEDILSILSNMVAVMERSPRAFKDMNEEDLRTHFLVQLNGQYEGQATGETFNYEGKTDILIRADGRNIFIAECKFWTGSAGLAEALDQLLGYTSWRDTKTALLVFNRDRNMSTVLSRVPETVQDHPHYKTARPTNSETHFRYVFGHRDDANREIIITILVLNQVWKGRDRGDAIWIGHLEC